MNGPIAPPPIKSPFDDPDTKLPSAIWVRWLAQLIQRPEPFTTYTPVVAAGSGAFTTVSAGARYRQIGKLVFVEIVVSITDNGSAAGFVTATLPFPALNLGGAFYTGILAGRAQVSGKMLQGPIVINTSVCTVLNYDNTYPGASGETLILSGFYEVG